MSEKSSKPLDVVLLFDECLPKMQTCSISCIYKDEILCCHRFNFNVLILYATDWLSGRSDLRIALNFLNLIKKNRISTKVSFQAKFILVTADKKFFKSARKQAKTKKNLKLDFNDKQCLITRGAHSIQIVAIRCKKRSRSGLDDLRCIVETLNKFMIDPKAF